MSTDKTRKPSLPPLSPEQRRLAAWNLRALVLAYKLSGPAGYDRAHSHLFPHRTDPRADSEKH